MNHSDDNVGTVERLNALLREELAAIKSYQLALVTLDSTLYHGTLLQCCRSHEVRAELLRGEIVARNGVPVADSCAWGTCARLVESGTYSSADNVTIAALADGEIHRVNDYELELEQLETNTRELLENSFIPEQRRAQQAMWDIRQQIAA